MPMAAVAKELGLSLLAVQAAASRLAAGGVLVEARAGCLAVRPAALREALVRDVFFNGPARLPIAGLLGRAKTPERSAGQAGHDTRFKTDQYQTDPLPAAAPKPARPPGIMSDCYTGRLVQESIAMKGPAIRRLRRRWCRNDHSHDPITPPPAPSPNATSRNCQPIVSLTPVVNDAAVARAVCCSRRSMQPSGSGPTHSGTSAASSLPTLPTAAAERRSPVRAKLTARGPWPSRSAPPTTSRGRRSSDSTTSTRARRSRRSEPCSPSWAADAAPPSARSPTSTKTD